MTNIQSDCFDDIAAPVFVLEPDASGVPRYTHWNPAAEREIGLSRRDVIGKTARDIFAGAFGESEYQHHLSALDTGKNAVYDGGDPNKDTTKCRRTTLKSQRGAAGSILRIIGTSIDISAEHEAHRLKTALGNANTQAEQFLALAAHDLRTPMRNISILTEMLREDFVDQGDGKLELIDLLEEVAVKSGVLLRDVLSHTQEVSAPSELILFDFDQLCRTLCDILDPRSLHNIQWPKMMLFGDKTAYQIVLRNLFDNAIKHGQKPHLSIDIDVQQSSADTVAIEVADNGMGFEGASRALVETGMLRADKGFGLFSVKRLLTLRGGSITVENRRDQEGCLIRFTLPGKITSGRPDTHIATDIARKTG